MPYIKPEIRAELDKHIDELLWHVNNHCGRAGNLNYVMTRLINGLLAIRGYGYTDLNEFIGALECCKLELYRRLAAPYEDKKCAENGDVFNGNNP